MFLSNLIVDSFKVVGKNPIINLLLVLFLIFFNLFTAYTLTSKNLICAIILFVCSFLFVSIFISGWFQCIKEANSKDESKNYFSIFLDGAGKNVFSTMNAIILYCLAFIMVIFLARFIALKTFGNIDFLLKDINLTTQNSNGIIEYFNSLPTDSQLAVYGWYFTLLITLTVYNFFMLFYFPSMFFIENKNIFIKPFIALKNSIVFTFKNFFGVFLISLTIHVIYFILALISSIFANNPLIYILVLFFYIYFLSTAIVVIFKYYAQKNNSDNRSECIGEN